MPEIKHWVVTETRTIHVTANEVADALTVAERTFDGIDIPQELKRTCSVRKPPEITSVNIQRIAY